MSLLQRTVGSIARQRLISSLGQVNSHCHTELVDGHCCRWTRTTGRLLSVRSDTDTQSPPKETATDHQWKLLYQRNQSRSLYPRATLAFSSFNTLYWSWYTFDFTPAVNNSAYEKAALGQIDIETLELLLVDSTMGYVGLGVALLIWGGSVWYPKHLISAIWRSNDQLAVSTLSLPFINMPSILGGNTNVFTNEQLKSESNVQFYDVGEINVSGERETNEILIKLDGEMGKKRGHLALQVDNPNKATADNNPLASFNKKTYLLDIATEDEVVDGANSDLLMALLSKELGNKPHDISIGRKKKSKQEFDEEYVQIRPQFGKKRR